jgi:hypothetical protein
MDHIIVTDANDGTPFKHQFGKLLVGTIAGFLASKMAEKVYVAAVKTMEARKAA